MNDKDFENQKLELKVIEEFGKEWDIHNYFNPSLRESLDTLFAKYTSIIDLKLFNAEYSVMADFGAGSGRWAERFSKNFRHIFLVEPSVGANNVLKIKFGNIEKFTILHETIEGNSIADETLDLAVSLGVLHHVPQTEVSLAAIAKTLKPGGIFLCYLYYKVEDKPFAFRVLFALSNGLRKLISVLPYKLRVAISKFLGLTVYFPVVKASEILNYFGFSTKNMPLSSYSGMPIQVFLNDSLDRFGTRLEKRYNKMEIIEMMQRANFDLATLKFSESEPFWTFIVKKRID